MQIDPTSTEAPYRQVAAALRRRVAVGEYPPGSALPTGAALAREAGVSRVTINNALRVLKDEGLLVGRSGSGVYVVDNPQSPLERVLLRRVGDHLSSPLTCDVYGYPLDEVGQLVLPRVQRAESEGRALIVRVICQGAPLSLDSVFIEDRQMTARSWREGTRRLAALILGEGLQTGQLLICYAETLPETAFTTELPRSMAELVDAPTHDARLATSGPEMMFIADGPGPRTLTSHARWFEQEWRALERLATTTPTTN